MTATSSEPATLLRRTGDGGPTDEGARRPSHGPSASGPPAPSGGPGHCAVLLLADIGSGLDRVWGYARFVLGPGRLRSQVPGLGFAKVLGSGHEGGFGLLPSASRQGLFALFDAAGRADEFVDRSPVVDAYRRHAREFCVLVLQPYASRGTWSGQTILPALTAPAGGPVAALTRASIRPGRAAEFWRHAPPSQRALEQAAGCRLAVGLGEAPLLRQATFSLWDSTAAMDAYARSGAHLAAIRAAHRDDYFSESMFVRFVASRVEGLWKGRRHG